ncbi:hypothetical protein PF010_g16521 [Phytophthora fragariae]|uniref:Uncharacterized protein n=1 Tax=Phytophthora fragariae TaxID=53985 RepID=A0A6G0KR25_9STRA|nr:hypothetical protein PF010_g16521 [Phytophthora fragariae]KAE9208795.1 hypothetical protein PF004_g16660 [Phytophthora fragariae]
MQETAWALWSSSAGCGTAGPAVLDAAQLVQPGATDAATASGVSRVGQPVCLLCPWIFRTAPSSITLKKPWEG